jgi:type II secretory pathway pseudopilin PulG
MSNENKTETKTKAEAPKADQPHAAAQNPFAAFDPMAMWSAWQNPVAAWTAAQTAFQNQMTAAQSAFQNALGAMNQWSTAPNAMGAWTTTQQAFQKAIGESFTRTQAWSDEYVATETQMTAKAHGAIDTWAQLAHDTINYTTQLSAQARKLSVDAARKAGFAGA